MTAEGAALGSGIPTVGNIHDIAHAVDPTARVAYVDIEPLAVTRIRDIVAAMRDSAGPLASRSRAEIRALVEGLEVVAPGVDVVSWPSSTGRPASGIYGLVARL